LYVCTPLNRIFLCSSFNLFPHYIFLTENRKRKGNLNPIIHHLMCSSDTKCFCEWPTPVCACCCCLPLLHLHQTCLCVIVPTCPHWYFSSGAILCQAQEIKTPCVSLYPLGIFGSSYFFFVKWSQTWFNMQCRNGLIEPRFLFVTKEKLTYKCSIPVVIIWPGWPVFLVRVDTLIKICGILNGQYH
jgi:hypothetical protein